MGWRFYWPGSGSAFIKFCKSGSAYTQCGSTSLDITNDTWFVRLVKTIGPVLNKNLSFAEANFGTLAECFGVGVHPRGLAQHSDMIRI